MGGRADACVIRVPQGGAGVLVTLHSFLGASQLKLELFTFMSREEG